MNETDIDMWRPMIMSYQELYSLERGKYITRPGLRNVTI